MKTFALSAVACLLMAGCSNPTTVYNGLHQYTITGAVKSFTETWSYASGNSENWTRGDEIARYEITFNEEGGIVTDRDMNRRGTVIRSLTVEYNADHRISRMTNSFLDKGLSETVAYEYDGDQLMAERIIDGEGHLALLTKYEYKKGRIHKEMTYPGGAVMQNYTLYQQTDNRETRTEFEPNGNPTHNQNEFEDGYLVKAITPTYTINVVRDAKGLVVETENAKIGSHEEVEYQLFNRCYTYSYDFDEHGNWIRRFAYRKGSPQLLEVYERSYEYR